MKFRKNSKHRGVAEVITTVLLLAVTVVGAAFVATWMTSSEMTSVTNVVPTITSTGSSTSAIKLMNYDTRDGDGLSQITNLDNLFDSQLCTNTCTASKDNLPANAGTDFIIIGIKNNGLESVTLVNVQVNEVTHVWDSDPSRAGQDLNLSGNIPIGTYPPAGTFSVLDFVNPIIPPNTNHSKTILQSGDDVRLLIKLDPAVGDTSDVLLNAPLRIIVGTSLLDTKSFVIAAGMAR